MSTSVGTGYDLSATTYAPDGKVFQIDYAGKAVENSGTAIAVCCKDGVVFGVEKFTISKMLVEGSNRRIHAVDKHLGMATAGLIADARQLANRARREATSYKNFFHDPAPVKVLAERLAGFVQTYTLYAHIRPFGTSILLGGVDKKGPQLYMIEPSGVMYGFHGCAAGKGRQAAKTELEKLKFSELTAREAISEIARIIYAIHDEAKDKDFELELAWVCTESGNLYQQVPKDLKEAAIAAAKAKLEDEMEDD